MTRFGRWVLLLSAASLISGSPAAAQNELEAMAERAKIRYASVPRKVLTFYYPWYGNPSAKDGSGQWSHWSDVDEDGKQIGSSTNYPALGPYDSHDPAVIARHCAWAREAGVEAFIVSWWGKGSFSDRAMPRILDGCRDAGIEVTIYYETVPRPRNAEAAAADVLDVLKRYGSHPAWLRVDGKPVVFIYGRAVGEIGLRGWLAAISDVNRRYPGGAVFMGDQMSASAAGIFDGIHTYNTAGALRDKTVDEVRQWAESTYPGWVETADDFGRISTITVIPGYDDTKIRKPGLRVERAEGASYRRQWEEAISADPHWILVTSWNEWHEGSEIEPSVEDGDQYLKMTAELAARFKSKGPRAAPRREPKAALISEREKSRQLAKLEGLRIGVLPDASLTVVWPLLRLPQSPAQLSWEEVAGWSSSAAKEYPVLIYAGGEPYQQTVKRSGDVDEGLIRYLRAGGFLVVLPSGPMPFHYNEQDAAVGSSHKLGLPLSVGGPGGGWEEPPDDVELRFVQVGRRLPHLPEAFAFPERGDLRWRPFQRGRLAEEDVVIPLLELRDGQGSHYGDAVACVEHKASEPKGGKVLYAWFELLNGPYGEALLYDLFAFVAEQGGS